MNDSRHGRKEPPPELRLIDRRDADRLSGLSRWTIVNYENLGRFPRSVRFGRKRLWVLSEIEVWIHGLIETWVPWDVPPHLTEAPSPVRE